LPIGFVYDIVKYKKVHARILEGILQRRVS